MADERRKAKLKKNVKRKIVPKLKEFLEEAYPSTSPSSQGIFKCLMDSMMKYMEEVADYENIPTDGSEEHSDLNESGVEPFEDTVADSGNKHTDASNEPDSELSQSDDEPPEHSVADSGNKHTDVYNEPDSELSQSDDEPLENSVAIGDSEDDSEEDLEHNRSGESLHENSDSDLNESDVEHLEDDDDEQDSSGSESESETEFNMVAHTDRRVLSLLSKKTKVSTFIGGVTKIVVGDGNEHKFSLINKRKLQLPDDVVTHIIDIVQQLVNVEDSDAEIADDQTIKKTIEGHLKYEGEKQKKDVQLGRMEQKLKGLLKKKRPVATVALKMKKMSRKTSLKDFDVISLIWNEVMSQTDESGNKENVCELALENLSTFSPLFDEFTSSVQAQLRLMFKVQEFCHKNNKFAGIFGKIIRLFYDEIGLSNAVILQFYYSAKTKTVFRAQMKKLINKIEPARESESEDEEN
ncbi:uncharacterized protein LOC132202650 [Neocloeon triangulifer]|uniref:uncharacterized protein LOC132202650 n=1 Tax=Neocloeon triangulifer TaxID=2078957 RepID=UPI00286F32D0|nr:uncharacterized protein LOC132202650 [Neocloeon triangulifer]